ncbi:zinc finger protein 658B isoform X2 [Aedes aegypti]|uniref:Uncharacterized protein n=1 Tax=Aedes aegypti TaxID=7159 RepID=A0A6I8TBG0_AEDAE|nr:zinc finger protein 658B isoform X2 [Aedes aegypti]
MATSKRVRTRRKAQKNHPCQMCRLCMSEESLENLFGVEGVHKWMSEYLSIVVSTEDRLSQVICLSCRTRLIEFHQFRERCQEVQDILQAMTKKLAPMEDGKQFQCKICHKVYSARKHLTDHNRLHGPKIHVCGYCGKGFPIRRYLLCHMKNHANEQPVQELSGNEQPNFDELPFVKLEPHEDVVLLTELQPEEPETLPTVETQSEEYDLDHEELKEKQDPLELEMASFQDEEVIDEIHIENVKIEARVDDDWATGLPDSSETDSEVETKEPFQCYICLKVHPTKHKLSAHIKVHGPKIHACEVCDFRYALRSDLIRHFHSKSHLRIVERLKKGKEAKSTGAEVKQNEENTQQLRCDECNREFLDKTKLKDHNRLVHGFKRHACPVCHKRFALPSDLKRHFHSKLHQRIVERLKKGKEAKSTEAEVKQKKENTQQLRCDECNKVFLDKTKLKDHNRLVHAFKRHACPVCHKRFALPSHMRGHMLTHDSANGKAFKCDVCQRRFKNKNTLWFHKTSQHGQKKHNDKQYQMANHKTTHNRNEEKLLEVKAGESFKCDICQRTFRSRLHLVQHKTQRHGAKKHACSKCGKGFVFRSQMQKHLATHKHRKERKAGKSITRDLPFKCDICHNSYKHVRSLRFHLKYSHGTKRHECHICGLKFFWRSRLLRHMKCHDESIDMEQDFDSLQLLPTEQKESCTNLDSEVIVIKKEKHSEHDSTTPVLTEFRSN